MSRPDDGGASRRMRRYLNSWLLRNCAPNTYHHLSSGVDRGFMVRVPPARGKGLPLGKLRSFRPLMPRCAYIACRYHLNGVLCEGEARYGVLLDAIYCI